MAEGVAEQAATAIENERLRREVRKLTDDLAESLRHQAATNEVLRLISRANFDLSVVLQALVETAARLCEADKGTITRQSDGVFYRAESYGYSEEFIRYVRDMPVVVDRHSGTGRSLLENSIVHIEDIEADQDFEFHEARRLGEFRSLLGVPMLRDAVPIGVITLTRRERRPFTDKQIELAATFADEAAIAIENVRLFDQVQQRTRDLSKSLDDLRSAQDRLIRTEKLAALGQLTAGIAHEIRNPLNFVNNFAALSADLFDELSGVIGVATPSDEMGEKVIDLTALLKGNLNKIVQHGKRADDIVRNMLVFSREGTGDVRPTDVNRLVEEGVNLAYRGARAENGKIDVALRRQFDPETGVIEVCPEEITRVLLNMIQNSLYALAQRKMLDSGGFAPLLDVITAQPRCTC